MGYLDPLRGGRGGGLFPFASIRPCIYHLLVVRQEGLRSWDLVQYIWPIARCTREIAWPPLSHGGAGRGRDNGYFEAESGHTRTLDTHTYTTPSSASPSSSAAAVAASGTIAAASKELSPLTAIRPRSPGSKLPRATPRERTNDSRHRCSPQPQPRRRLPRRQRLRGACGCPESRRAP